MLFTRRHLIGSAVLTLLAPAVRAENANGFIELEARPGEAQILPLPAPKTRIWGFGGQAPGPVLRVKFGQELRVRLINRLDQPTALHWRGMRLPNGLDGAAGLVQNAVAPGETREILFTPPDAGTFLYQPLIQPHSGEQFSRGLFGAVVVEEAKPIVADDELVLLLNDWRLDATAQITSDFDNPADVLRQGRFGAVTAVNGQQKPAPIVQKPGARLRLRLVNAACARIMRIAIDGGSPKIIAVDGQSCDPFEPARRTAPLGPGARCDVLLDLPPVEGRTVRLILRGEAEMPDAVLLEIVTKGVARPPLPPVPTQDPSPNPLLPSEIKLQAAKRLDLVIEGGWRKSMPAVFKPQGEDLRHVWTINGRASTGLDGPTLFSVKKGTPVALGLVNKSLFEQVIHVQGHVVRLLHDLDDGWEPYWRDSVIIPEHATKHIAFVADNPGKWLICSAVQEHFANGLAGWFEVT
jgi:FtsP/CotA-like multicopper oxidase with cupredoxin domain